MAYDFDSDFDFDHNERALFSKCNCLLSGCRRRAMVNTIDCFVLEMVTEMWLQLLIATE